MATLFVKHPVNDFSVWKRGYDEFASLRQEAGVTAASVHRDPNDPNMVIAVHQFGDVDAMMAFVNNPELKEAMEQLGVSGPPEFWFGEDVEHTAF